MSGESAFIHQVAKIRRRFVLQTIHAILLNAVLIFLTFNTALRLLDLAGIPDSRPKALWYFIAAGIAVSLAVCIGRAKKRDVMTLFIGIDHRLDLHDTLSTAYEYLKFKKPTEFADLLLNDAAAKLGRFGRQELVPVKISRYHWLTAALLIINIVLYPGIFFAPATEATPAQIKLLDQAAKLLKNQMTPRVPDPLAQSSDPEAVLRQKLRQISHNLNDRSHSLEQRSAALDRFLKALQGEQIRLAHELATKLDSTDLREVLIPKFPDAANFSASQLHKLERFLRRTLKDGIPNAIGRDIESLQELYRIEKLISQIIENLKNSKSMADSAVDNGKPSAPSAGSSGQQDEAVELAVAAEALSDQNRRNSRQTGAVDSGISPQHDKDLPDEVDQPEGYSASAGQGTSKSEKKGRTEIEKNRGTPTRGKTAATPAPKYLIQIRALTDTGRADLNAEEILVTYRREVESVLQKEDIPINYRQYIKNYFTSIGIETKENAHELQ